MFKKINRGEFHIKQRTDEWYNLKAAKVSGSRITSVLGTATHARTKNAIDLLGLNLAIEHIHGYDKEDDFVSHDMQRGINLEPVAFKLFRNKMLRDFVDVFEVGFVIRNEHSGSSSDAVCSNNWNVEIKCPNRKNYFDVVANGNAAIKKEYLAQMQMQMLCNGTDGTYFINYYEERATPFLHVLEVERDKDMLSLIEERIDVVAKVKMQYIEQIQNNTQLIKSR